MHVNRVIWLLLCDVFASFRCAPRRDSSVDAFVRHARNVRLASSSSIDIIASTSLVHECMAHRVVSLSLSFCPMTTAAILLSWLSRISAFYTERATSPIKSIHFFSFCCIRVHCVASHRLRIICQLFELLQRHRPSDYVHTQFFVLRIHRVVCPKR